MNGESERVIKLMTDLAAQNSLLQDAQLQLEHEKEGRLRAEGLLKSISKALATIGIDTTYEPPPVRRDNDRRTNALAAVLSDRRKAERKEKPKEPSETCAPSDLDLWK